MCSDKAIRFFGYYTPQFVSPVPQADESSAGHTTHAISVTLLVVFCVRFVRRTVATSGLLLLLWQRWQRGVCK